MRIICYYTATSQGQPSRSPWRENNSRPPGIRGAETKIAKIQTGGKRNRRAGAIDDLRQSEQHSNPFLAVMQEIL